MAEFQLTSFLVCCKYEIFDKLYRRRYVDHHYLLILASSLMTVKVKNMEESVESLERSLCDFVTLYTQEQQALKTKVEHLEYALSYLNPQALAGVQDEGHAQKSTTPGRGPCPLGNHALPSVDKAAKHSVVSSIDLDVSLGRMSPQVERMREFSKRGKSASQTQLKVGDLKLAKAPVKKAKSQVNIAMDAEDLDDEEVVISA